MLLVTASAPAAPMTQEKLDELMRQLEKDISSVRGLKYKAPVKGKIIARSKDVERSLQGYYNLKDRTLYVFDDLAGNYQRGVLIHEMVHALQDQHFNLTKLHEKSFDSDAELALAALIEGDATFTMIEVLKKEQPAVARMLDAPLEKSRDLQRAFLYSQGARYVRALKERGGWESVNFAYRFKPSSTADILHPEGVATIDLGPGKTRGELALIQALRSHESTAADAVAVAAGWRGDRYRTFENGHSWLVAFAGDRAAQRGQTALAKLYAAQSPNLKKQTSDAAGDVWSDEKGEITAVLIQGARVLVVEAPSALSYRTMRERAFGPLILSVYSTRDRKELTFGEFTDRLMDADLVCIGETHDSELHHRVQLQIIKALYARDERLAVGMEMFQRPFQKVVDRYFRGDMVEEEFLSATEYRRRWGFAWSLYRPIVVFCRNNGIPLAALNVSLELRQRVSKVGYAKLTDDEKKALGEIDFQVKAHRDYWYERLAKMHGESNVSEERKERGYQVMTIWDEYMGASAAAFQQDRQVKRMVVLAGSGHIERSFGIPDRAVKRTGGKAVTVGIAVDKKIETLAADPTTDYIVIVR
jgi:uncharacterized iron-regulated protein